MGILNYHCWVFSQGCFCGEILYGHQNRRKNCFSSEITFLVPGVLLYFCIYISSVDSMGPVFTKSLYQKLHFDQNSQLFQERLARQSLQRSSIHGTLDNSTEKNFKNIKISIFVDQTNVQRLCTVSMLSFRKSWLTNIFKRKSYILLVLQTFRTHWFLKNVLILLVKRCSNHDVLYHFQQRIIFAMYE